MNTFYVDVISFFLISHIELETNKKENCKYTHTHTHMRKPLKRFEIRKYFGKFKKEKILCNVPENRTE